MTFTFEKLYSSPWGRLLRRFIVVGLAASLAFLADKLNLLSPVEFIDGLLAFGSPEWLGLLKVFVGAGVLAFLDKLRRELGNIKNSQPVGEK